MRVHGAGNRVDSTDRRIVEPLRRSARSCSAWRRSTAGPGRARRASADGWSEDPAPL